MRAFIIRRLLASVFVLWVVTLVTFSAIFLLPGDVIGAILGPEQSPDQAEALRKRLNLDAPFFEQYADWIGGVLQGDFGTNIRTGEAVGGQLLDKLKVSGQLGLMALLIALGVAVPIGMAAGARPGTFFDYGLTLFAVIGVSIPNFFLGLALILLFAVELNWFPALGFAEIGDGFVDNLKSLTLPAFAVGIASAGSLARQVRASMVEVLRQDYVRTARAKGLRERTVIARHAFRNALIPVVTVLGLQMSIIVGGTIIIETIFQLPGMGKFVITSLLNQEVDVVQGVTLVIATGVLLINLVVDISYAFLDPRIRYS